MEKPSKEDRLKRIVCKGLEHLQDKLDYGQSNVVNKLRTLKLSVSPPSLSNIKNGKSVGLPTLGQAAKGIQAIMEQELDLAFDSEVQDFCLRNSPDWIPSVVPENTASDAPNVAFKLHVEGRVSLQQKTGFIDDARREVIEVGVRLNSFSSYFISQNESAYKMHIISLLRKGVNIKGYLLDPDSNEARLYFDDRAKVQAFEKDSIAEIKKVVERLKALCLEFKAMKLSGKFEIYLYKHIPYSLFLVVDGESENGKMMVSPYLYGVRRANCPVLEITKRDQPFLYRRYLESMQLFLDGAQKLT